MTIDLQIPETKELIQWGWEKLEPYYQELKKRPISQSDVEAWLADWTQVSELTDEIYNRLYVATSVNTADENAEKLLNAFMEKVYPKAMQAEQDLKQKLLESGLEHKGFAIPLRNMRAEADLFREENLPLKVEEEKLSVAYDKIVGAQTVEWEGAEKTVAQMEAVWRDPDREKRKRAWDVYIGRKLQDRQAVNESWRKFFALRCKMAANAGRKDYRIYCWQDKKRFDYTPEDCLRFQDAIEEAVVPAVSRLWQRRKEKLGIQDLRYYDIFVDMSDEPPLKPFKDVRALTDGGSRMFYRVAPQFGAYFDLMDKEELLDLDNRKNKAYGGYCTDFSASKRPFIFSNAVGIHRDVQTLIHEGGHCFHAFETFKLPYMQQRWTPMEFNEVASMAMELLASPYLTAEKGGFYTEKDAARALVDFLEESVRFWPYMAIVDAFQHWAYLHPDEGGDPDKCDAKWDELEDRFRPDLDWSGDEDAKVTGWHRKDHIHQAPFYYVEYGLAQLGAVQVWANALKDQAKAVEAYQRALALGGTVTLPELFATAGAKLAFDAGTLGKAVRLMEETIYRLEEKF